MNAQTPQGSEGANPLARRAEDYADDAPLAEGAVVPFEPGDVFGYQDDIDSDLPVVSLVAKDQHAGFWVLRTRKVVTPLSQQIGVVFVARRHYRSLWQAEYESLKDGEENLIVCRSADSHDGFGLGRRAEPAELLPADKPNEQPWREQVGTHQCADGKQSVCAMAREWICRPHLRALVALRWQNGPDIWTPAWLEAKGTHFPLIEQAYLAALQRQQFSLKWIDGRHVPTAPIWYWGTRMGARRTEGRKAVFIPELVAPAFVEQERDRTWIDNWVRTRAIELWKQDKAAAKAQMLRTGAVDADAPARTAREPLDPDAPAPDFGAIPF